MQKWGDAGKFGSISSTLRPLPRNAAGKRCGPVEDVIAWAWREELPKMAVERPAGPPPMRSSHSLLARYAQYRSVLDLNAWGCVPDMSVDSWPCDDALMVAEAVMAIDETTLQMPEDWQPARELDRFDDLGARAVADAWRRMTRQDDAGDTVLRVKPSELIIRHALKGIDPSAMALDDVTMETARWANRKERWFVQRLQHRLTGRVVDGVEETVPTVIEVNGVDSKGRPMPGAYRKHYLDPDPVGAIMARAEYEILLSALGIVVDLVAGRLVDVVMLASRLPPEPWVQDGAPRVLIDKVAEKAVADAEAQAKRDAFARRYPRWFRRLERAAAKIADAPA